MSNISGPRSPSKQLPVTGAPTTQAPSSATQAAPAAPVPAWQAAMDPADVVEVRATAAAAPAVPTPKEVATQFYDAFVNRRVDDMEKLYSPDVKFKDAIFKYDDRAGTMNMWRKIMKSEDAQFVYKFDRVEGNVAIGKWVADYELNGRKIHNEIESRLTVVNGKITNHEDNFPLGKWARQAFPIGPLADFPPVQWLIKGALRLVIG